VLVKQNTIKESVACFGVGLHSGKGISMKIHPASENTGILFKRTDITDRPNIIKAIYSAVVSTTLCTTISNPEGVTVATIEHIMAALWGSGIDNALIELDGPEVPIMDGSSEPFVFLLECAGVKQQNATRHFIEIVKNVEVNDGKSTIIAQPSDTFSLDVKILFNHDTISTQEYSMVANHEFKTNLADARTFGFEEDIIKLRAMGLALGGSLDNAVVIGKSGVLNKDGLRHHDEFVRHKALDVIGDLYLAGGYIKGHFTAICPGHTINNRILHSIFADHSCWRAAA
jgi:UDP-3-O-[3-hydroxymyristoyl] N-acetylglucosamine deacetylase